MVFFLKGKWERLCFFYLVTQGWCPEAHCPPPQTGASLPSGLHLSLWAHPFFRKCIISYIGRLRTHPQSVRLYIIITLPAVWVTLLKSLSPPNIYPKPFQESSGPCLLEQGVAVCANTQTHSAFVEVLFKWAGESGTILSRI